MTLSVVNYQIDLDSFQAEERVVEDEVITGEDLILKINSTPERGRKVFKSEVELIGDRRERIGGLAYFYDSIKFTQKGPANFD